MAKTLLRETARRRFFAPLPILFSSCRLIPCCILLSFFAFPSAAAVVQGVLLDNKTGQPLAHTRVAIEGPGSASGGNTAWTGTAGQFSFTGLPAGAWSLTAYRRGYVTAKYGQPDWKSPGSPIVLAADGTFSAVIRMKRMGVVTGEILDENKLPLPGILAVAYRQGSSLMAKGAGMSDDRGAFRITGLEPGRYVIRTNPHALEDRTSFLPTFFGQTARAHEARTVVVSLEEETGGVSIVPMPGVLSTLSGAVTGGPAKVYLFTDMGRQDTATDLAGQFRFELVPPGQYEILAEGSGPGEARSAWQRINVAKENESISLELSPSPMVRVKCQEKDGKPFEVRAITVFARSRIPDENARRLSCGDNVPLSPGDWAISVLPPNSLYVYSLRAGRAGKEVQELELRPGQRAEILLTVSGKPATLRGKVLTGSGDPAIGAPVYLNPLDPDLRARAGGLRRGRTGQDGRFILEGLPPGRYEVLSTFATVPEESSDWTAGRGKVVDIQEGDGNEAEVALEPLP